MRRNSLGIVRETHYGLFSSHVTVELANGSGRIRVPASDVRRTGGNGERGAFALIRDWHRAKRLAALLLALPAAFALARFLIAGGHPSQLVLPIVEELIDTFFALITGPFGGIAILALAALYLRTRFSR